MADENEVLKRLVVEEKDIIKEMEKLVEEASKHFRIEKPGGRIIFQNFGALSDKQRIAVVLVGKYFANRLKLIETPSLSISEIAKELGRPMTALSGQIKELVTNGYVEYLSNDRKYKIACHRIREVFNDVLITKERK